MIIDIDFETYSEAGMYQDAAGKWHTIQKGKPGIACVGAPRYAEHDSTRVLRLCYDDTLWREGEPPPTDLFNAIKNGAVLGTWNLSFEYFVWHYVCVKRLGWPPVSLSQWYDRQAQAMSFCLPPSLEKAGAALGSNVQKDKKAGQILKKASVPGQPPLTNADHATLDHYNRVDVQTQKSIAKNLPMLRPFIEKVWRTAETINFRGAPVDVDSVNACIVEYEKALDAANQKIQKLTNGKIETIEKNRQIVEYVRGRGVDIDSISQDAVNEILNRGDLPTDCEHILRTRQQSTSAAVKKLYALKNMTNSDGRIRSMFRFHGAHTGRFSGSGPQPQNFPSRGLVKGIDVDETLKLARECRLFDEHPNDCVDRIKSCMRGLFKASPGRELIDSDYSSIESVVLSCLANETWRIDAFKNKQCIYSLTASALTGVPIEEFHSDHPLRKSVGKVAELGSGYGGSFGAWKNFGADDFMTEEEIKAGVGAWRAKNPNIVRFWYGLQDAAMQATERPGRVFEHNGISYKVHDAVLYCRLPSGRTLKYHDPKIGSNRWGAPCLTYMFSNTNPKKGGIGWIRVDTWGGTLTENVVQAVSADILMNALTTIEETGKYPIVLHVHDQITAEPVAGSSNLAEYESLMCALPQWCEGWPIQASGGWIGERYRK